MVKITRKPSILKKPLFNDNRSLIILKAKPQINRKPSLKYTELKNNMCIGAKNDHWETMQKLMPERPASLLLSKSETPEKLSPNGTVKATVEIFEKRNSICLDIPVVKPKVPDKSQVLQTILTHDLNSGKGAYKKNDLETVQIISIPAILPQRRCDSMYETTNIKRTSSLKMARSEETISNITPNTSFLWRKLQDETPSQLDMKIDEEEMYEELNKYEYCASQKYEEVTTKSDDDDGYEYCSSSVYEHFYEMLPPLLPLTLPPSNDHGLLKSNEELLNCYESVYAKKEIDYESNYESIYNCQIKENDSIVSSDQLSNSLYDKTSLKNYFLGKNITSIDESNSDLSLSDYSDDWIDITDNENTENSNSRVIMVKEKQRNKESSGWLQRYRQHYSKFHKNFVIKPENESESDHHYETLESTTNEELQDDDYDSFDTDAESESSYNQFQINDGLIECQLPEPPNNQTYVLTRLAAHAGKQMQKLRRNWSLRKTDFSKSLSRMTKRKSRIDLDDMLSRNEAEDSTQSKEYENFEYERKSKSLSKKGFLNKFRRSISANSESFSELTVNLNSIKRKSTFYLIEDININNIDQEGNHQDSEVSFTSSIQKHCTRPQTPPPPIPQNSKKNKDKKSSTSWYAEVGLFKNTDCLKSKHPNAFWYSEIGLYQPESIKSISLSKNSGNINNLSINNNNEEYCNLKNNNYYNASVDGLIDENSSKNDDRQLRLEDEPLYQFYDAAVLDSVCNDGLSSDFDSDSYEEIVGNTETRLSKLSRPSAMELISPKKNSLSFTRTLWCEIPEVIQSSVLNTLNTQQKKLQEAKFEMMTSEASYLNSLNLLNNHFINKFRKSDFLTIEEHNILFSKVDAVRKCSEKLLIDLEKCWQDNILLHGVCDIIQKHSKENFHVYITYCENQICLDDTLKQLKKKPNFCNYLQQLESSTTCQSLTLYSFLMLPMQRVTRWPLLVDAVLKRLSPQDPEYITCQHALATTNNTVKQCNEGARRKEREKEMRKISNQIEFDKSVPQIEIFSENRWLIRSGNVVCMQPRTDETKLTFGKRFIKQPVTLFLFNDMVFVTKIKNDNLYTVIHYCPRNLVELTSTDMLISLPLKDTQRKHLIFLTLLENQFEKTVEFLISCNSESDKERWIEALTPPKSEDPDETLYECWDCPQVTAIHNYVASQPDELALSRGDVINVLRKMADGWFHGERIRDGQTGWFPANYTIEIANPHVRSRNLKQRYRLLAFSESYLKIK